MMRLTTVIACAVIILLQACSSDTLQSPIEYKLREKLNSTSPSGHYEGYILPNSSNLNEIPQDPKNELTTNKVELGKMLFYETGIGLDPINDDHKETYSCATCHVPDCGFMPGLAQGIADGGIGFGALGAERDKVDYYEEHELDVQGARPLNLMNVAFTTNTSWSGQFGSNNANVGTEAVWNNSPVTAINHLGYFGLESQAIESLHLHRQRIDKEITDELGYTPLFDAAFPNVPESDRYNDETGALAISAYLRSLTATEAPFQHWLKGDANAMTNDQKEGAALFFGKAGCYRCHNGPALNNADECYALGVKDLYETGLAYNTDENEFRKFGRGACTQRQEDMYKFKVPQSCNMKDTPF